MSKIYNVLVFPGGTEVGLEIWSALCQCKDVRLCSAGLDVSNHAPYVFARHYIVPSIHNPAWVDSLNQVIIQEKIDYVFPAYDDVIVALAQNAHRVKARIVSSPLETCLVTRSKSQTYRFFRDVLPVPTLYDSIGAIDQYPIFVKPDRGQGSQDTHIVYDREQLSCFCRERKENIVVEYLPGEEYTIDCFSDREAGLLFCGGRQRVRIRSGISMDSRSAYDKTFTDYANAISKKLVFHGAWFFQVKKDRHGVYKLLEIAPRIAGTMALYRVQGVNFPLLSIYEQERIPLEILTNKINVEIDRALINRYKHELKYSVAYIDLDDTLILNGIVNISVIRFIYRCINMGIRVVLITKHASQINKTLSKHRLAGIFDEIIHMEQSASKADYIRESDAILIDDSFSERKNVSERCGILTFDCSMLEMLIDERI
jgi:carbamoyl-phosphate synthase large subunit